MDRKWVATKTSCNVKRMKVIESVHKYIYIYSFSNIDPGACCGPTLALGSSIFRYGFLSLDSFKWGLSSFAVIYLYMVLLINLGSSFGNPPES